MAKEYGFADKDDEYKAGEKREEKVWGQDRSDSDGTLSGTDGVDRGHNEQVVRERSRIVGSGMIE